MELTREEYELTLSQMATRVELAGLKLTHDELIRKMEEIGKRCREDGDMFSSIFLSHEQRIKRLEQRTKDL